MSTDSLTHASGLAKVQEPPLFGNSDLFCLWLGDNVWRYPGLIDPVWQLNVEADMASEDPPWTPNPGGLKRATPRQLASAQGWAERWIADNSDIIIGPWVYDGVGRWTARPEYRVRFRVTLTTAADECVCDMSRFEKTAAHDKVTLGEGVIRMELPDEPNRASVIVDAAFGIPPGQPLESYRLVRASTVIAMTVQELRLPFVSERRQ